MRILVDMDDVLADFDGEFLKRWRARHPEKMFVPLEERKIFYVKDSYPKELQNLVEDVYLEPGFFREMMPVEGGVDAVKTMQQMGLEIFFCTSPLYKYKNCVLEKYEWVERHFGSEWVNQIVLTRDKTLVKGDILIDDKPVITGAESVPMWEHVLYDRPYNRNIDRKRLVWANWKSVLSL